jgi:hypothetical protein
MFPPFGAPSTGAYAARRGALSASGASCQQPRVATRRRRGPPRRAARLARRCARPDGTSRRRESVTPAARSRGRASGGANSTLRRGRLDPVHLFGRGRSGVTLPAPRPRVLAQLGIGCAPRKWGPAGRVTPHGGRAAPPRTLAPAYPGPSSPIVAKGGRRVEATTSGGPGRVAWTPRAAPPGDRRGVQAPRRGLRRPASKHAKARVESPKLTKLADVSESSASLVPRLSPN